MLGKIMVINEYSKVLKLYSQTQIFQLDIELIFATSKR